MTLQLPCAALKALSAASIAILTSAGAAHAQVGVFQQLSNDVVAIQMESASPVSSWTQSTATPGFTGEGYFRWDGPNFFSNPGNGVFDGLWTGSAIVRADVQRRELAIEQSRHTAGNGVCIPEQHYAVPLPELVETRAQHIVIRPPE